MTASKTEQVLEALQAALAGPLGVPEESLQPRNETLPTRIPARGVVILRDGDPGVPEVTLSPLAYHYEHRAEIDVVVDRPQPKADEVFDELRRKIGMALADDRTLGGLCDWIEGEAPAPLALAIEGAESLKAATITVVLHYTAADPLL
jgi:hypothetical protein